MSIPPEQRSTQQTPKGEVQCLPSLCRGLYHRVAQKLGCDPSYVSRVARGERTSQAVSDALRAEIQLAWSRAAEFANSAGELSGGGGSTPENRSNASTPKISKRKARAVSA